MKLNVFVKDAGTKEESTQLIEAVLDEFTEDHCVCGHSIIELFEQERYVNILTVVWSE